MRSHITKGMKPNASRRSYFHTSLLVNKYFSYSRHSHNCFNRYPVKIICLYIIYLIIPAVLPSLSPAFSSLLNTQVKTIKAINEHWTSSTKIEKLFPCWLFNQQRIHVQSSNQVKICVTVFLQSICHCHLAFHVAKHTSWWIIHTVEKQLGTFPYKLRIAFINKLVRNQSQVYSTSFVLNRYPPRSIQTIRKIYKRVNSKKRKWMTRKKRFCFQYRF